VSKPFGGFQLSGEPGVSIPLGFFQQVLGQISEIAELQVSLCVFKLLEAAGGLSQPVSEQSVVQDRVLREALRVEGTPNEPDRRIGIGLDLAVGRGTLLKLAVDSGDERAFWYYLNTVANQVQVAAMSRGAIAPPADLWLGSEPPSVQAERPTVFRLYEQNIGVLTPLIAERLVDALETYSPGWIEDAIGEAVTYNRRSWRYIIRILENWTVAGRGERDGEGGRHETHRRGHSGDLDPAQYKNGRYLDRTRR
jgi:DNA replication protein